MTKYISMATLQSEMVDCRMLHLELEFYELTHPQLKQLAQMCLAETKALTDDHFFLQWDWLGRNMKADTISKRIHVSQKDCDFGFEGDVFSDVVHNLKTFKQYDKKLKYDICVPWQAQCIPRDYPETYAQLFSKSESPEHIKNALLRLFTYEKKKMVALWRKHDLTGGLFTCPYDNNPGKYHGKFKFSVCVSCLGAYADEFSQELAQFACKISNAISHISARVALSPISSVSPCSGHMKYFGDISDSAREKAGYDQQEWLPYYYLPGAEWFNILSPLQKEHVPNIQKIAEKHPNIEIEILTSGGIVVRSSKSIVETDIPQYLSLKKLLYHALYPGKREVFLTSLFDPEDYSFMAKPRDQWEYAPIFEDEIVVLSDRVVFCHNLKP